jgi:hypothetical protein
LEQILLLREIPLPLDVLDMVSKPAPHAWASTSKHGVGVLKKESPSVRCGFDYWYMYLLDFSTYLLSFWVECSNKMDRVVEKSFFFFLFQFLFLKPKYPPTPTYETIKKGKKNGHLGK